MTAEQKYHESTEYNGNEPFLRHNKIKYLKLKKEMADALQKEEAAKAVDK